MKTRIQNAIAWMRYGSVVVVIFAIAFVAIDHRDPGIIPDHGMYSHFVYTIGWPLVAVTHQISEPNVIDHDMERFEHWAISWSSMAINAMAYLAIVVCTLSVARYRLPLVRLGHASYSSIFAMAISSAVIAQLLSWEFDDFHRLISFISPPVGTYYPITLYKWWISLPVLYGIACVPIVLSNVVLALMKRIQVRRG